jgi:hypothetical protein
MNQIRDTQSRPSVIPVSATSDLEYQSDLHLLGVFHSLCIRLSRFLIFCAVFTVVAVLVGGREPVHAISARRILARK